MARAMVPIGSLRYAKRMTFPVEAAEVFHQCDLMEDDGYSYTFQVRSPPEPARGEIRQALRERVPARHAQRLIEFLDAHDWDVAFFVDSYEDC